MKRTRWTFDDPCTAMEHTERSTPFLEICSESTKPDMIIVGVYGGGDAALSLSLLTGAVQQGLLATAQDHKDTFENGSKAGVTTPVLRVLDDGGTAKVRETKHRSGGKHHHQQPLASHVSLLPHIRDTP